MGKFQQPCGFLFRSFSFLSFFPPFCFVESGLFPGGETSLVGEASSGAEVAAEAILLAQQLLLEKSLFTGNVFRKKPNTYIPSARAWHGPGRAELPKAPYLGGASTKHLGFRKSACFSPGLASGAGQLQAAPRGRGRMWRDENPGCCLPGVVKPVLLNPAAPAAQISQWGARPGAGGGGQDWARWGQLIRAN